MDVALRSEQGHSLLSAHAPAPRRPRDGGVELQPAGRLVGPRSLDADLEHGRPDHSRRGQRRDVRARKDHQVWARPRRGPVSREFRRDDLRHRHDSALARMAPDRFHGISAQHAQPHPSPRRHRARDRWRAELQPRRYRLRRPPARALVSGHRDVDRPRVHADATSVPLHRLASPGRPRPRRRGRSGIARGGSAERRDLLASVPFQGLTPDRRLGANPHAVHKLVLCRDARRGADRIRLAPRVGLGHSRLQPGATVRADRVPAGERRIDDHGSRERQRRASRLLHAVPRRHERCAFGRPDREDQQRARRQPGAHRSGQPCCHGRLIGPDQSQLDGLDRRRRCRELLRRTLRRQRVHQLPADRHRHDAELRGYRPHDRDELFVSGPRQRRREQPERLFERGHRDRVGPAAFVRSRRRVRLR